MRHSVPETEARRLLTGGPRTVMPRHRTLLAALDWSFDLLDAEERQLLRLVSVFRGGWTLAAAEAVCAKAGIDRHLVLERLTALVDQSLVTVEHRGGAVRYGLLETVREYSKENREIRYRQCRSASRSRSPSIHLKFDCLEKKKAGSKLVQYLFHPRFAIGCRSSLHYPCRSFSYGNKLRYPTLPGQSKY